MREETTLLTYMTPTVTDLGDLRALTANSKMTVADDMEGGGDS